MLNKTVTYEDYNGNQRTDELWFNLTKTEILKLTMDLPDNTLPDDPANVDNEKLAARLFEKLGNKGILEFIETLLIKSYGVKSEDGRRFIKTPEMAVEFSQTPAYDAIMMEFMTDTEAVTKFVNGVIPSKVVDSIADAIPGPQVVPNN